MNICGVMPVVFERRGNGLALATVEDVSYWLTKNPDVDGQWRYRLTAQWTSDEHERRAQVGPEWIDGGTSDGRDHASQLVRQHHDRLARGEVVGRAA